MSGDKNNVISLEEFKRKKQNAGQKNDADTSADKTLKLIPSGKPASAAEKCVMIWLYCPACKTLEYTAVKAPAGRRHNCGTQVYEKEIELNAKREISIALLNLNHLKHLEAHLIKIVEEDERQLAKETSDSEYNSAPKRTQQVNNPETDILNDTDRKDGGDVIRPDKENITLYRQMIEELATKENTYIQRLIKACNGKTVVPYEQSELVNDSCILNAPRNNYGLIISEFFFKPERHFSISEKSVAGNPEPPKSDD